jgi:hypothetical protein
MTFEKKISYLLFYLITIFMASNDGQAQETDWHEKMKYLQYSPRYFGPNAFPLPELRSGHLGTQREAELKGEYHEYEGDRTRDVYTRFFVPVAEGLAGLEISCVIYEYYTMTEETVKERHAAGRYWDAGAHGDVIISSFYQLLRNEKWADIMMEASLKTASGNRLADARYTDAVTYWFDLNIGRYLYKNPSLSSYLRIHGLAGFYCWMTNDLIHRQNDAFLYSAGISGTHKNFTVNADIAGFYGYINNGDRPLQLRVKLNYEYRNNILSCRYKHGMKDCLYDCFSLAYIRCF